MGGFREAWDLGYKASDAILGETLAAFVLWLLIAVFAVSGLTKVSQPAIAAQALVGFGVVGESRNRLGRLVGAAELVLCMGLIINPQDFIILVTIVLWIVSFLIVRALRMGEQFPCACFGHSEDLVSRRTLYRTAGLAVTGTLAVVGSLVSTLPPARNSLLEAVYVLSALSIAWLVASAHQLNQSYLALLPEKRRHNGSA